MQFLCQCNYILLIGFLAIRQMKFSNSSIITGVLLNGEILFTTAIPQERL